MNTFRDSVGINNFEKKKYQIKGKHVKITAKFEKKLTNLVDFFLDRCYTLYTP